MKKRISIILTAVLLLLIGILPVYADAHPPRVVDECGILSEKELDELNALYDKISTGHNMDVALVIVDTVGSASHQAFADDYYDHNGYGMGKNDDGILFLYAVEDEYTHITTHGSGIDVFTDSNQDSIFDKVNPKIKAGSYVDAFTDYANICDKLITKANSFNFFGSLIISVVIGFVAALIVTGVMKGKLKSVRSQAAAASYMKQGSLAITDSRDMFLYRQVTRTRKAQNNSGSSTHSSSSGRTHGGSGRSL